MFNKRVVNILCWILQILIIAKTLFALTMFVWGAISGVPPISILPQGVVAGSFLGIILLLQELGGNIFIFVVVATMKTLAVGTIAKKK